jgi:3-mercaptopyruvate sulfurtransferase SseA
VLARLMGLRKLGYENVRVMSAGIKGWLSARLPIESGARGDLRSGE